MPYKEQGGTWRAHITIQGQRYAARFLTKKEAVEWEAKTRKRVKDEQKRPPGMDLLTFCGQYLDFAKRFKWVTYEEKRNLCRRIMTAWGPDTLIEKITPAMTLRFLDARAAAVSANSYNKDRKNLLAMWSFGKKFLGLKANPLVDVPKRGEERPAQYVPPAADILKVLAAATREEEVFLDCYLQTGGRRSEITRWNWHEDISFERKTVRLGSYKTRDGSMKHRMLPMTDDLYESLWWWWQNRPDKETPYVFPQFYQPDPGKNNFNWLGNNRAHRFLIYLCRRAKVRPFGYHALRRFVASVLYDKHKVSLKKVQIILGHASASTTERYLFNLDKDLTATMDLLTKDDLMAKPDLKVAPKKSENGPD